MRKPVARAVRSKFNDRNKRQDALRRAAASAAPAGVTPFEALEDRRLFSVLATYYNDGFWGNGDASRPVTPTNLGGSAYSFPNQQVMVARVGDVSETVANIDFDYGDGNGGSPGSPKPGVIRNDNHSTLFVGKLVAPTTGTYEILGYGDDDTHVFVDGQLVSSDPGGHGQEDPRGAGSVGRGGGATKIDLVAGQSYDLAVLQAEGGGGSGVRLRWVLPGGDTANPVVVPAANLTTDVTPVTAPTGLTRDTSVTNGVKVDFTDTSKTELRYDLQRRQGTGAWGTVASGSINDNSITDYSAKFGTAYEYRVVAWNLQGEAVSAQTVSATLALPAAEPGAQGYYFNDQWWKTRAPANGTGTDVVVGSNPDATGNVGDLNENWGDGTGTSPGSPAPGVIRTDNFSTAFTGKITAPETGDYYVLGFSDDDSYVWVDGKLVSADPGGHGIPANTAVGLKDIDTRNKVTLTAGQSYDFVALQSEGGGGAGLILRWITPTAAQEAADAGVDPSATDIPVEAFTSNQPAPLAAPTALTATATDVSVVRLSWTDNAKSEVRYALERSTSADFSNATRLLLPINSTSYQDTGLTRSTQYFYRLTAENFTTSASATTSVSTPGASTAPAAPTNLVAYNLGNRNRISFVDNAINESGYIVERRLASGGTFAAVAGSPIAGTAPNVSGGTITYDDSDNVVAGQTYVYRVRAVNVDNIQSANSNEATTSVHGLRATIYDSTGRFAARNFFEQPGKDPIVRIDPNVDYDFGDGANGTPGSPDPTKVDADLYSIVWDGYFTPTTTESYTFYGESDDGIRVFVNGQLVVDQWVDRGTTESAGTPVALTAGQPAEIRVQYYENGGGAVARLRYSTDTIAKQVVPLNQLTPADASNPLRAPTNVDATSFLGQSINVTWLDNSASETGYRVERTSEAPSETTVWQAIGTVPANQSGFIDSNVADPTTAYYYRVVALGAGGTSLASDPTLGSYSVEPDSAAVNFTDFSDPNVQAQWVLNPRGPAGTGSGPGLFVDSNNDGVTDRLRLTDGGAPDDSMDGQIATAYLATPVTVGKGFTSSFDFVVGGPGAQSANPADGFTWILQAAAVNNTSPARTTPVGGGGGGLGYTGIGNSVALKFDIYNQLNQTGLYFNGEGISDDPNFARNRVIPNTFDINSGQRLHVTVSYDPTSKVLTQTIDDVGNPATAPFATSYVVDIPATLGSGSAYVGFGGATGGETARQEILSFAYNPTAPAASANVSDVYVRGSAWATTFKQYLEAKGLGDDVYGYRLASNGSPVAGPAGNPEQVLPWINLDEVVLKYASAPTGSGIPTAGSVAFTSANGTTYTIASVTPVAGDPTAFVLRLNQPLGGGNLATGTAPTATQNGDHITLGVPGGGLGGGNFSLRMDVLQGDTDHTGETGGSHSVLAADYSAVKKKFFKDTTDTTTGDASYSAFHDVNGSGNILANDFSEVKKRFFQSLAPATTASAQGLAAASATRDLFGNAAIL